MELQHLADFNTGGTKRAGVGHKAESKAANADAAEQDTPFKDQVKKQIDQSKTESSKDKNENNQQDRSKDGEPVADAVASEGEIKPPQEGAPEHTESSENTELKIDESAVEDEMLAFNNMLNVTLAPVESSGTEEALVSPVLPEVGKTLPPSTAMQSKSTNQQGVASTVQQAVLTPKTVSQTAVVSPATVTKAAEVDPELLTADLKTFKSTSMIEKPGFLNTQNAVVKSDVPAAEMIANASRMQQVPLATALSSSVATAQNMNAAPITATAETGLSMSSAAPLTSSLSTAIGVPVQGAEWSGKMTEQVSMMVKGGFQQADIKLNPAHLGPLEVKLNVSDDKANISFVTQHAPVKEAIDSAMPRLRDMLEEQGLSLVDVDVSTQSEQQQANDDTEQSSGSSADAGVSEIDAVSAEQISSVEIEVDAGLSLYA